MPVANARGAGSWKPWPSTTAASNPGKSPATPAITVCCLAARCSAQVLKNVRVSIVASRSKPVACDFFKAPKPLQLNEARVGSANRHRLTPLIFFEASGHSGRDLEEALVGVEPTMADLQSAALATWLQRLNYLLPTSLRF